MSEETPTFTAKLVNLPKPELRGDPNLPKILRDLADAVERGEVIDYVAAYIDERGSGNYTTEISTGPANAIVLSSILHAQCVDKLARP